MKNAKLISCLGSKSDWNNYYFDYDEAVLLLYADIVKRDNGDLMSLPLLYLMRHTLEIGFKMNISILSKYSELNDGLDNDNNIKKGHVLDVLQTNLETHFRKVAADSGLDTDTVKEFNNLNSELKDLVNYFNDIDRGSFTFRYPFDNDGNRVLEKGYSVDLREIMNKYKRSKVLLMNTADVLNGYFEMVDEYRNQYY